MHRMARLRGRPVRITAVRCLSAAPNLGVSRIKQPIKNGKGLSQPSREISPTITKLRRPLEARRRASASPSSLKGGPLKNPLQNSTASKGSTRLSHYHHAICVFPWLGNRVFARRKQQRGQVPFYRKGFSRPVLRHT